MVVDDVIAMEINILTLHFLLKKKKKEKSHFEWVQMIV